MRIDREILDRLRFLKSYVSPTMIGFFSTTFGATHLGMGMWMCLAKGEMRKWKSAPFEAPSSTWGSHVKWEWIKCVITCFAQLRWIKDAPFYFLGGWIKFKGLPKGDEGGQWWDSSWVSRQLCDHFSLDRCWSVRDYGPCGLDSPTRCLTLYAVSECVEPKISKIGLERWFGGDQYMARN